MEQQGRELLRVRLGNGQVLAIDTTIYDRVPHHSYALSTNFISSVRVLQLLDEYSSVHAEHRRGGPAAVPNIATWDEQYMSRIDHTDILFGLFLAASTMGIEGLADLCAQKTASIIKGRPVQEEKNILGINTAMPEDEELELQEKNNRIIGLL